MPSLKKRLVNTFSYNEKTGILVRKSTGNEMLTKHNTGYLVAVFEGKQRSVHHLVWARYYGKWPKIIDHINGIKDDNRISNLREATKSQNCHNTSMSKNNTSGIKGLSFGKDYRCPSHPGFWYASIMLNNKRIKKTFPFTDVGKKQAIKWLKSQRQKLHGEYANG